MRSGKWTLSFRERALGQSRLEEWRELVSPLWDVAVSEDEASRFSFSAEVLHLGNCILGNTAAHALETRRSSGLIGRMGVDHIMVQLRLSGTYWLQAGASEALLAPGDIAVVDMSRPFASRSTDYEAVTLAFPRNLWASVEQDQDELHGAVIRGASPLGVLVGGHLRAFSAQASHLSPQEASAAVEGTANLIAACVRPRARPRSLREAPRVATLIVLRRYIDANLASPDLSADHLARRFGLSRSALYRLFQPVGGIATYVRRRRLARAYDDLSWAAGSGPVRIGEVARRWGFESPTHFVHAFRQEFGCAPRDIRASNDAAILPQAAARAARSAGLYGWVMDLAA